VLGTTRGESEMIDFGSTFVAFLTSRVAATHDRHLAKETYRRRGDCDYNHVWKGSITLRGVGLAVAVSDGLMYPQESNSKLVEKRQVGSSSATTEKFSSQLAFPE